MLDVCGLTFNYQYQPVLKDLRFKLETGRLLHLRGDNGSGKTTLLRLLAALMHPAGGDIYFNGQSIYKNISDYQHQLCYVGHQSGLSPLLTVRENCLFDLHWPRSKESLDDLLIRFDLQRFADSQCAYLSAGQRRRVGLLRLAMTDALLWLLDEPLVALDQHALDTLTQLIRIQLQRGGMVILTSHQALPSALESVEEYCL